MLARMAKGVIMALWALLLLCCSSVDVVVVAQLGGHLSRGPRHTDLAMAGVSEALSHDNSDTTLYSADNYLKCNSLQHVTPKSTEEIATLIKGYTSHPEHVTIRATRPGFHSSAGFVCSGKRGSSKAEFHDDNSETGVTVLMQFMNRVAGVDAERKQMTVESGMTLLQLVNAAEANGMSVPAGALSIYANLTVGGVILSSAHGSGFGTVGSLGDLVTAVKWVNAKGEIVVSDLERSEKEVRALVGGLGLLGIATEFTLQLQANSRTILEVRKGLSDENIVADLKKMMETETPHVIVFWRPDFGNYKTIMFTEVTEGNEKVAPKFYPKGKIAYLTEVDGQIANAWGELLAKWEEDAAEESASAEVMNADMCNMAKIIHDDSIIEDGEGNRLEHATVRTNYAMVSDDCSPHCLFDVKHMSAFIEDTEFTLKISQLESWVSDVKHVVKSELANIESRIRQHNGNKGVTRCMPPGYFWLRFCKGNKNLLSTATGEEDVVFVQWTSLHSAKLPNKLAKQSTIAETLEQLTLCKYKGRPHWGKNQERVFRHPECKVRDNFPKENIEKMVEMQDKHDPKRVFEPALFRELLERKGPEYRELCTPHFWCYCEEDSHCPHGHACGTSASFPEYKICKLVDASGTLRETSAEL